MTPGIVYRDLLALVTLYRVTLAGLWVNRITHLDEHRLTLTRTLNWRRKQTVGTIRYGRLHRLANNLRDEHPRAQTMPGFNLYPLPVLVLNMLRIAEGAGGDLERDKWHAGNVSILRTRLHDTQPRLHHSRPISRKNLRLLEHCQCRLLLFVRRIAVFAQNSFDHDTQLRAHRFFDCPVNRHVSVHHFD